MENMGLEYFKDKKVLITGHTGFKGSWLSFWLTKLEAVCVGYSLAPIDKDSMFDALSLNLHMRSIIGDINDVASLKELFLKEKPDIVFHMAAQSLVLESYSDPHYTFLTNVQGTVNVLEAIRCCKSIKSAVIVTTDKCYENKEWVWGYRENEPLGGNDPYSASKACDEIIVNSYRKSFLDNIGLATARAGNVIGGGDFASNRLVPDLVKSIKSNSKVILRNPNAIRPWQHVLEPLYGYMLLAEKSATEPNKFSRPFNFGPSIDKDINVLNLVKIINEKWGNALNIEDVSQSENIKHEANYLKLDPSLAKDYLSWSTKLNVEEAIDLTVSWYKQYYSGANMENITLDQIEKYEANI